MMMIGPAQPGATPLPVTKPNPEATQAGAARQGAGAESPAALRSNGFSPNQPPVNGATALQDQSSAATQDRAAPQGAQKGNENGAVGAFDIAAGSKPPKMQAVEAMEQMVAQNLAASRDRDERREDAFQDQKREQDRVNEAVTNFQSAKRMLAQPDPTTMSKVA